MSELIPSAMDNKIAKYDPYLKYTPLPQGHIRLLKIHESSTAWNIEENPNTWNLEQEIEISLISLPLDECPPYITLSYTWGEPGPFVDPTTSIFTQVPRCFPFKCHGKLVLATRNLRNVLRRLRQFEYIQKLAPADTPLGKMAADLAHYNKNVYTYWIDAICVDQDNLRERSEQVLLMSRIYRQAQCTIAWLGERDAYTAPAMQALMKISGFNPENGSTSSSKSGTVRYTFNGLQSLHDSELTALAMLMARSWFTRTWILQEAVLAESVVVTLGSIFMGFELLLTVGTVLNLSRSSRRLLGHFLERQGEAKLFSMFINSPDHISRSPIALAVMDSCRLTLKSHQKPNFMAAAGMVRLCESTDPRDRIYGILGIASEFDVSNGIAHKPDYSLTVVEVYVRATASVIETRGDLACLTLVCDSSFKRFKNLPTWCPDYSAPIGPLKDYNEITRTWRLGLTWSDAQIPKVFGTSLLGVDGIMIDVVTDTATIKEDRENKGAKHGVAALFNLAAQLKDQGSRDSPISYTQRSSPFETLWRTIILDSFDAKSPASETVALLFPAIVAFLLNASLRPKDEHDKRKGSLLKELLEELQKLQASVNRIVHLEPHADSRLPKIDLMRQHITFAIQDSQKASDGLLLYAAEEISRFYTIHKAAFLAMDLSGENKTSLQPDEFRFTNSSNLDKDILQTDEIRAQEILSQHLIPETTILFRKFFITKGNTLGSGHVSIMAGDEIWFLYGASAPVILRPLASGNYMFIGEAYVHGVMHGEAGAGCKTHEFVMIE